MIVLYTSPSVNVSMTAAIEWRVVPVVFARPEVLSLGEVSADHVQEAKCFLVSPDREAPFEVGAVSVSNPEVLSVVCEPIDDLALSDSFGLCQRCIIHVTCDLKAARDQNFEHINERVVIGNRLHPDHNIVLPIVGHVKRPISLRPSVGVVVGEYAGELVEASVRCELDESLVDWPAVVTTHMPEVTILPSADVGKAVRDFAFKCRIPRDGVVKGKIKICVGTAEAAYQLFISCRSSTLEGNTAARPDDGGQ